MKAAPAQSPGEPGAAFAKRSGPEVAREDEIHGATEVAQIRAAFWLRHGAKLAGKAYLLRRPVISVFGPEVCPKGLFVEWRPGYGLFGWMSRRRTNGILLCPNPYVLRLSDLALKR